MSDYLDYEGLQRYHELILKQIGENEEVVSAALNDLNTTKADKTELTSAISNITDTKNTAGSSNSSSTLYLIGAPSQSATGVLTYSNSGIKMYSGALAFNNNLGPIMCKDTGGTYRRVLSYNDVNDTYLGYDMLNTGESCSVICGGAASIIRVYSEGYGESGSWDEDFVSYYFMPEGRVSLPKGCSQHVVTYNTSTGGTLGSGSYTEIPTYDKDCLTVIINNTGSSDVTFVVPHSTYKTPDGQDIEITIAAGGYGEVSLLRINGSNNTYTIYARAI